MTEHILKLRKEYKKAELDETHTDGNPFKQFKHWFDDALEARLSEPNAFVLSTVNKNGQPSARVVLLKDATEKGFTFYTNYTSRKGAEIEMHPLGCFTFFWHDLERQIRIEGKLEKVAETESNSYFSSRPRGSQIGAWSSPQSEQISSRKELELREEKYSAEFGESNVPRPAHWGGYVLIPNYFEFWQGRENRMHDRICYRLDEGNWERFRLAP
jgi:pyridoxamine 5'-phosphate oxidase